MPKQVMLYNPGKDQNGKSWEPAKLAPFVDRFIMTPGLDREDFARKMLAVKEKIEFHLYCLQHGAHLAAPNMPNNNQALTRKGEAEAFLKQYPAIALHTLDGKVLLKNQKQDYFVANTAHPRWRSRYAEHIAEVVKRAPFFKFLFLDDLGTEKRFNYVGYQEIKEFATREAYFEHTCAWLTYTTHQIALPNGLRPGGNLQAPPDQFNDWKRAAGIMIIPDGAVMIEWGWAAHNGDLVRSNWDNTLQKAQYVIENGGQLNTVVQRNPFAIARGDAQAVREFEFILYSQMLVSDGNDGMRVADQYDDFADIPLIREVDGKLGKPLANYKRDGALYVRPFENHTVIVDPDNWTYRLQDAPIIVVPPVDPPQPSTVKMSVTLEFEVPASVASAVQAAFDSLDITVKVIADA
jgi:hypothetical protein